MRLLFIGDIVGRNGLDFVCRAVTPLRQARSIDLVIANAENVEDGSGITKAQFRRLVASGVDGVTLGDHIYRKREIVEILNGESPVVKPANFPPDAAGRDWMMLTTADGRRVAIFSLLGRVFMRPVDCPMRAADRVLAALPTDVAAIFVDLHAEATSDKQLIGKYLDGRVSAVIGTHTHVTTADECIMPGGTAFQCDVGMTGPHDGVIGRRYDRVLETTYTFLPTTFLVATGELRMHATIVEIDPETRRAVAIERVSLNELELAALTS